MIRVLVVEDTPVVQELLVYLLNSDPAIRVVGTASNGEEALEAVANKRPDVVTMDVHMPRLNGLDATRRIMETHPTPIVVVSGSANPQLTSLAFTAIEAGALAVVDRPRGIGHPDHEAGAAQLLRMVKAMSEVPVVKRWVRRDGQQGQPVSSCAETDGTLPATVKAVAIGASTGGPPVLHKLLASLPADLPVPILIVQHISPGFSEGLVEWLQGTCALPIHLASQGARALPGNVYFAPDGFHMGIEADGKLSLSQEPAENGHRPSVAHLFRSVTRAFGSHAVGMLLTGMGKDGAQELKLMKDAGAVTVAQDKSSSVVHGMPGEAILLDGATFVVHADRLASMLTRLTNRNEGVHS
ncbi:MAG TPA: chemotaxis-specific protein-glutamate methyltransferase CheB [Acidobacteriaceae bacterium]|jgi:two-component system chemotaxis response regulator CheB